MAGGRPSKDHPAWRPQLRLPAPVLTRLKQLDLEDIALMLEWAMPRWPGRLDPATLHPSRRTAVLRPARPKQLVPTALWYEEAEGLLLAQRAGRDKEHFKFMITLGFRFNDAAERFERPMTGRMGSPTDRIAETAAMLYQEGYPVEVPSTELADRIVQGQYLREQERWLSVLKSGDFVFRWEYGGDAVYSALGCVHTARWDKQLGGTVVSRHAYEQIEDFALSWGFAITDDAQRALLQARKDAERDLIGVEITVPPRPEAQPAAPLSSTEEVTIPDDLLDDD